MIPYQVAAEAALNYLEALGAFDLSDENVSPDFNNYPPPNVPAIYGTNVGMGLSVVPKESKDLCGTVLFTVQMEIDGKMEQHWKARLHVSIAPHLSDAIKSGIRYYKEQYGTDDVALKNITLQVKTSGAGRKNLHLQPSNFEMVPAWVPELRDVISTRNPVWTVEDGKMKVSLGGDTKKIITHLWGDRGIYDQGVIVPAKGPISMDGKNLSNLKELFVHLIGDRTFIRAFKAMPFETYKHRVNLLEELFVDDSLMDFREDFDIVPADVIEKIYSSLVETAPAPPVTPAIFKLKVS